MATFGKTSDGASETASSADRKRVSSASPSTNGTATKITVRCRLDAAGSTVAKGIIYSDTTGAPDALLATSDEVTVNSTTEAEVDFPLSGGNQIAVTSGTTYWIGVHWQDPGTPGFAISRDATANGNNNLADTYSDGPSNPYGSGTSATGVIDAYVTYTEDSGTLSVNVSDSVTVSEAKQLQEINFISVSDNITLSESTQLQEVNVINTSDSITVTESVQLQEISFVNVSDNITLSESLKLQEISFVNVSDNVTVSEAVTLFIPFFAIAVSENITVSESVGVTGPPPPAGRYILGGTNIKRPTDIVESNSTIYVQQRTLDGQFNRDFFGDNKRVWVLSYDYLTKDDYDTIKAIHTTHLSTSSGVSFSINDTNYTVSATVLVDINEREFVMRGESYITSIDLILTEE